jgi:hypothetical protein
MKVPKMIPKVIRRLVLIFKVTIPTIKVHIAWQMKAPTVREHQPVIVAVAAPKQAALPRPRE